MSKGHDPYDHPEAESDVVEFERDEDLTTQIQRAIGGGCKHALPFWVDECAECGGDLK